MRLKLCCFITTLCTWLHLCHPLYAQTPSGAIRVEVELEPFSKLKQKPVAFVDTDYCKEAIQKPPRKDLNLAGWLESTRGLSFPTPAEPKIHRLEIKNCEISRSQILIEPGDSIEISSSDPINFDFSLVGKSGSVRSRALPPNLKTLELKFSKPDQVALKDQLHPWIQTEIFVRKHPHYAVSAGQNILSFESVPQGEYELFLWNEDRGVFKYPEKIDLRRNRLNVAVRWPNPSNSDEAEKGR